MTTNDLILREVNEKGAKIELEAAATLMMVASELIKAYNDSCPENHAICRDRLADAELALRELKIHFEADDYIIENKIHDLLHRHGILSKVVKAQEVEQ